MAKGKATGDAVRPGLKPLRLLEPRQLAANLDQRVLNEVVGVLWAGERRDVAMQCG